MKVIDVSKWNSGDSLGMDASSDKISRDFWDDEESHCISLLFMEQEDRDQVEELAYIEGMTKNKLFEIFIKMCPNGVSKSRKHRRIAAGLTWVLTTPEKRKASPLPELDRAKTACCNRNSAGGDRSQSIGVSPVLRRLKKGERPRAKSVSAVPKSQQRVRSWCRIVKK